MVISCDVTEDGGKSNAPSAGCRIIVACWYVMMACSWSIEAFFTWPVLCSR
jgi:hypothetical protein